jgi:hypothetical protein
MSKHPNLVRSHFKVDGEPKKKFSEKQAKLMARRNHSSAYECDFPGCGGWHIGTSRAKK